MKTHRRILIICFILMVVSFPFIIYINDGKVYDVTMTLLTSGLISLLIELPTYLELIENNRRKLYSSLYYAKFNALLFLSDIDYYKKIENPLSNPPVFQYAVNISININLLNEFDECFYILHSNNQEFSKIKMTFIGCAQNVDLALKKFNAEFYKSQLAKANSNQSCGVCFNELQHEVDRIIVSCDQLLKSLEDYAPILFTNKQLKQWELDDTSLNNAIINSDILMK